MRLDSSLKESRPQYISAQNISTLFDALDEREIASFILYMPSLVEIIGDDFLLGTNLVSFNRAVVPLFELSFLTKSQKLTSA
jgi:hypothetical protein